MRRIGTGVRTHRTLSIGVIVAGIVALAAVLGVAGCADRNAESVTTTYAAATETTAAASVGPGMDSPPVADGAVAWDEGSGDTSGGDSQVTGSLIALEGTAGQKVISDAQMEIEVESGQV